MSYNTRELYETVNYPWKTERRIYHDSIECGLGYDDICSIIKEELVLYKIRVATLDFSHSIVGFPYTDSAELSSYFFDLLSRQESSLLSLGGSSFRPIRATFACYNSFKRIETFTIIENPGSCSSFIGDIDTSNQVATREDWQQTRLSSALRFFRGSQPLINTLFGTKSMKNLQPVVFEKPKLTLHDFIEIIEEHPRGEEMEYSLSVGLICCLEADEIFEFVEIYWKRVPRLIPYLCSIFSDRSPFISRIVPVICRYLSVFPDNIALTNKFTRHLLYLSDITNAVRYMPLIESSAWSDPECAVTCAYFCHLTGRIHDSIAYLCMADSINNKVEEKIDNQQLHVTTPTSSFRYGPTSSEKTILLHFEKQIQHNFDVLANQIAKTDNIRKITSNFQIIPETKTYLYTKSTVPGCSTTDSIDMHLYDPGLGGECIQVPEIFSRTLSSKVVDAIIRQPRLKGIFHQGGEAALQKKRPVSLLIMAIGIESKRYVNIILKKLLQKGSLSGCEFLLILKAISLRLVTLNADFFNYEINVPSQREANAIVYTKALVRGIQKVESPSCKS